MLSPKGTSPHNVTVPTNVCPHNIRNTDTHTRAHARARTHSGRAQNSWSQQHSLINLNLKYVVELKVEPGRCMTRRAGAAALL